MMSNTTTAKQAFTLMELMIVIVIIGILAAVGMVTFGGQAEKAKIAATKANLKSVKKYIPIELMKCSLGEAKAFSNHLTCSNMRVSNQVSQSVTRALRSEYRNPYKPTDEAIFNGNIYNCNDSSYLGRIYIYDDGTTQYIRSCPKLNEPMVEHIRKIE